LFHWSVLLLFIIPDLGKTGIPGPVRKYLPDKFNALASKAIPVLEKLSKKKEQDFHPTPFLSLAN